MIEDRTFIRNAKLLIALNGSPHAACKLVHTTGLERKDVDLGLRWLRRRGLVVHDGAWCITPLGAIAIRSGSVPV